MGVRLHQQCFLVVVFAALCFANKNETEVGFIKSKEVENLTIFDVYIIRPKKLSNLCGSQLANLALVNSGKNAALFEKTILACTKKRQQNEFLKSLQGNRDLPEMVQDVLAHALSVWYPDHENQWKYEMFRKVLDIGSPVLAYLPRSFLFSMEMKQKQKFLFHLEGWTWPTSRSEEWARKRASVKRLWVAMLHSADPTPLNQFDAHRLQFIEFILTGSTPNEMEKIKLKTAYLQSSILNLPLDPLQARAVFSSSFRNEFSAMPSVQFTQKILPKLTPTQIVSLEKNSNSEIVTNNLTIGKDVSWASAAQLAYLLVEKANRDFGHLSVHTVSTLGKWIYAVPSSNLRGLAREIESLPRDEENSLLTSIDSCELDGRQARILASSLTLENALDLHDNLLLALSTARITEAGVLPQNTCAHLLSNLPADSALLYTIYNRVHHQIGQKWVMESMLDGEQGPERFALFISFADVRPIAWQLAELIKASKHDSGWPANFLQMVAHRIRANSTLADWTTYLMSNPKLMMGLTCDDLADLGPNYGVPIMTVLGQHVQSTKQKYPENLKNCALLPMLSYLKYRTEILNGKNENLLDTLYKAEIMSVGGIPFAQLHPLAIQKTKNWAPIVEAIGSLSVIELLEVFIAPGSISRLLLSQIALLLEGDQKLALSTLDCVGNLFQFLPFTDAKQRNFAPRAFELWLEARDRRTDTALCVSSTLRSSFWYRIIVSTYGSLSEWSAGTVAMLGGLLIAVPASKLTHINPVAIETVADQLDANLGYTPDFIKLCERYLGTEEAASFKIAVNSLLEFTLKASNELAAKVLTNVGKKKLRDESHERAHSNVASTKKSISFHPKEKRELNISAISQASRIFNHPMFKFARAKYGPNSSIQREVLQDKIKNKVFKEEKLYCGALKMAKYAATSIISKAHLEALDTSGEFHDCLPYLGTFDVSALIVRQVWDVIVNNNISVDVRDIGNLASQVSIETIRASNLSDLDVVNSIGKHLQLWELLDETAQLVLEANDHDLTPLLAGNMGRLLCGRVVWDLMTSSTFLQVYPAFSSVITRSSRCPPLQCLRQAIAFGARNDVFGALADWDADLVYLMGGVMAGLNPQQMEEMTAGSLKGLHQKAVMCLCIDSLRSLKEKHLSQLSLVTLEAIFSNRFMEISEKQRAIVKKLLVSSTARALLSSANKISVELHGDEMRQSAGALKILNIKLLPFQFAALFVKSIFFKSSFF
ncbi:uncharacterized protein LOC135942351 [Cloeon dipterum]|uniref:uncharacterized protein LOC135942351 n=1 Tax=Cloeon dipterum TaxID=197152 RepID=UPI00322014A7